MSFIQRELDKISAALRDPNAADDYDKLFAAQQALSWALEPDGFASPYASIYPDATAPGNLEGSEGCSFSCCPGLS